MKDGTKTVVLKIVQLGLVLGGAIISGVISDRTTKKAVTEYLDDATAKASEEPTEEEA